MSQENNTILFERASEMMGEFEGTDLERAIYIAIEDNDLERLEYMVRQAELEVSRQDEVNDAY